MSQECGSASLRAPARSLVIGIASDSVAERWRHGKKSNFDLLRDIYLCCVVFGTASRLAAQQRLCVVFPWPRSPLGVSRRSSLKSTSKGVQLVRKYARAFPLIWATPPGINVIQADDFETWYFSLEVFGDSLYKVGPSMSFSQSPALTRLQGRSIYPEVPFWWPIPDLLTSSAVCRRREEYGTHTSGACMLLLTPLLQRWVLSSTFIPMDM